MRDFLAALGQLKWADWLYTIFAAGISAGASSICANPVAAVFGAQQFTPRQLAIMAGASAIWAVAGVLKKSPLPDRKTQIALLPGVHTMDQVNTIAAATAPGSVPTQEIAAAIIAKDMTT